MGGTGNLHGEGIQEVQGDRLEGSQEEEEKGEESGLRKWSGREETGAGARGGRGTGNPSSGVGWEGRPGAAM